ncbi:MAG: carbamoyl phosphate synthase large subunit [Proteobacteria bacterium]|nr:carbamoyl phosphate synthase large subunit [Pseudomonadota bacterium]
MPRRADIHSILLIGAGPIVIGQACEFDYSGVQACKALMEEGYRVILVNSNPATIMTDPEIAHKTYVEPITVPILEKIIASEKPDAILPTMGGQTALNCALALSNAGILKKYNVELIGASEEAIDKAENREKFKASMEKIGLETPTSYIASNTEDALKVVEKIGYPTIIRPSFTLGGAGGGIAYNKEEFLTIVEAGIDASPLNEILIEESVLGWKEFEMEVVRDSQDNAIIICSIENLDPMGVHTGDSITVAPAQTLTDKEYQLMRNASLKVLREIGVDTGGSNVQFAVNPENGRMIVIEMNPRVSRSSALASKATGFPIAKVAAKLAVGYTLDELDNDITSGATPASFEPSIDYVVTKIPRFAFEKFPLANKQLTTQMKSVGEVMAIGRTFQESLQKALRGLEIGVNGFVPHSEDLEIIEKELRAATDKRLFFVADGFRMGMSLDQIHQCTKIDPWFLAQIEDLVENEKYLIGQTLDRLSTGNLRKLKKKGFSDSFIGDLLKESEEAVRNARWEKGIRPVYKRVDTCAGEFDTNTAYLYSTYEQECEARPSHEEKVMILGGGPNRIGQGIEFDYCCVHAAFTFKAQGYETIMVNCNPETVSTDYDTSDRLYFEPLTLEDVLEIISVEKPKGVVVQYGGQTPLKLAGALDDLNVPILGTSPDSIDRAEDRERFKIMLRDLGLEQPDNRTAISVDDALVKSREIGYPLVVRPSYVLGGRAMEIVYNEMRLATYVKDAIEVTFDSPILLDRFLSDALEVDVDAVSDGKSVIIGGIMEHIEQAGVHSGDSACTLPPYSLSLSVQNEIREATRSMARALKVVGLMNVQFAVKNNTVFVLEVNPRASRTIPYVSKATGKPLAKIAARCMVGVSLEEQGCSEDLPTVNHYAVKEAVFPFIKFPGVDTILGPEMKSTGEVMGIGKTFGEAFIKSQLAAGVKFADSGKVFISVKDNDKDFLNGLGKILVDEGFDLLATKGTAAKLLENGLPVVKVNKVKEGRPHVVDMIKNGEIVMIINTVDQNPTSIQDSYSIRRSALQGGIAYYTTIAGARAACTGLQKMRQLECYDLQGLSS